MVAAISQLNSSTVPRGWGVNSASIIHRLDHLSAPELLEPGDDLSGIPLSFGSQLADNKLNPI